MGAGAKRLADGSRFEQQVLQRLLAQGYPACRFGQSRLDARVRDALGDLPGAPWFRWLPDILLIGNETGLLIDVKSGRKDTSYWVVERVAHEAHRVQEVALGFEIVYIWPDFTCNFVDDLPDYRLLDGFYRGQGSGTPFWRVPKSLTRAWSDLFVRSPEGRSA